MWRRTAPVLLVRAYGTPVTLDHAVVPLDGSPRAEETRSAQGREPDAARAQAEAAEAARAQAEAAVRVRNEVLGTVAHDLRAPLTGILGRADLLTLMVDRFPDVDRTQLRDHITGLSAAATRMAGMIAEITDVIQLDMGQPLALALAQRGGRGDNGQAHPSTG